MEEACSASLVRVLEMEKMCVLMVEECRQWDVLAAE